MQLPASQPGETKSSIIVAICLIFLCVASGLALGLLASGARLNLGFGTSSSNVLNVALSVVPDKSAPTQDAFVLAGSPNDNTIHAKVGQLINFTITTDDNALNMNFTGSAGLPFTVLAYESNGTAMVSTSYPATAGNGMVVAHTFTTSFFNIPLPPISVVTFSYTFTKAGTYSYHCIVPCGRGMSMPGYMSGEIVVQ
jgi:hypothetical protein